MRILFGYENVQDRDQPRIESIIDAAPDGIEIVPFCVSLRPGKASYSWTQLMRAWKLRHPSLIRMYRRLHQAAQQCDLLLVHNGANLHPEWLSKLDLFKVASYCHAPGSPTHHGPFTSTAYDAVFYSNPAERFRYIHWGCRRLAHLPPPLAASEIPARDQEEDILSGNREIELIFWHDRHELSRRRAEILCDAFPDALRFGSGWEQPELDPPERQKLLRQAKICLKLHALPGPWDNSILEMAACGVLPICDNKTALGHLFCLKEEAVGYNTVAEGIEQVRYFLEHGAERQRRAKTTYRRFWRDYHPQALWKQVVEQTQAWIRDRDAGVSGQESSETSNADVHAPRVSESSNTGPLVRLQPKRLRKAARNFRDAYRFARSQQASEIDERFYCGQQVPAYHENPEMRGVNMAQERLEKGNPLDWPNILALNWAVTQLIGDARQIIEVGAGTGPFAEFASIDPNRQIDAFEDDEFARQAARGRVSRANVRIGTSADIDNNKKYDLLVSVEVVEHVDDLGGFLRFCRPLAPRAIFTTPNRTTFRGLLDNGPPKYAPHVREYTTGEFYWVLRQHYQSVSLYYMPDVYFPWIQPMTLLTPGTPIIAQCRGPYES